MQHRFPDAGLLVALLLAGVALRPQLGAVGPLVPRIQHDLAVSHAVAGLLGTIPVLCMGVFAPLAAGIARRVGTVQAVGASLLALAVLGVLRVAVPAAWEVLLLTVPLGIGIAVAGTLMPLAVRELLPARLSTGTGVYAAGMNVGSALSPALAVPLASWWGGWRASLAGMAVAGGLLAAGWLALALRRSRGAQPVASGATRGGAGRAGSAPPDGSGGRAPMPLRSGMAWVCSLVFGLLGVMFYGVSSWLPDALQEHGWQASSSGYVLAVAMGCSAPAALTVPGLTARYASRRVALALGALLSMAAVSLLVLAPGGGWAWAVLLGASLGVCFATIMSLPLDLGRGPEGVAAAAGMILGIGYTISAVGPFLLGAVRDATGSYSTSLWLVVGAAGGVLALSVFLSRERLGRAAACAAGLPASGSAAAAEPAAG